MGLLPDWLGGGSQQGTGLLPAWLTGGDRQPQQGQGIMALLQGLQGNPGAGAMAAAPLPPQGGLLPPGAMPGANTPPSFGIPSTDGVGGRLIGALGGFAHGGGPIGGIANAITTLATGQQTDPNAIRLSMIGQQQRAVFQAFKARGLSDADATAATLSPEMQKALMPSAIPQYKFEKAGQSFGRFNEATGRFDQQGISPEFKTVGQGETGGYPMPPVAGAAPPSAAPMAPGAPPAPPTAGSFAPVMTSPDKPPEGYQWRDPKNQAGGLTGIEGGPAAKVPANEAAYLAMMQASKQGVAQAKDYFLSPDFKSGFLDATGKAIGQATRSFDIGRHQRSIGLATEAALRIASGAAVPESEVARYANFYTPSVYDSVATRQQKLDALQKFMAYAERNMGAGRAMPPPEAFAQGGAASGAPKNQGRVQTGASWPPPPQGFTLVP